MKLEFLFFNADNSKEYVRETVQVSGWNAVMTIGEQRAQELLEELNLEEICWNYTVLSNNPPES